MSSYIHNNNIICTTQSGFWSDHSATSGKHHLISQWTDTKKSSNTLALLVLDFCKAFDLVDYNTLLVKLNAIGVQGQFYATNRSYLSNRYKCVRVGSTRGTLLSVTTGVPQG